MFIERAQAGGVIDNAPTFSEVFLNAFIFLLQVAGIIGIIGVVLAGVLYLFANGDSRRIRAAKNMLIAIVIGFAILFGAWIIVQAVSSFFS
ncbi:MAG: hypothetical protein PHT88_03285 [Candidatus Moranbacteria bacterium]|nr:hypothetical protein [Candidatus Moranbacteria bacterium]